MYVELVLLINCVIAVNCGSIDSNRIEAARENELLEDMKSEIEAIRQLLVDLTRTIVRGEIPAIQEIKSAIEDIREDAIEPHICPSRECPFGFDYLPEADSCFTIIFEEMDWGLATARCRDIMPGVHLAAITSQDEQNAIAGYVKSQFDKTGARTSGISNWCPDGYLVWISGQRRNARCHDLFVWKALSGIEVPFNYTHWGRGEPNCAGDEACAQMASCKDLAWNDRGCESPAFPLCQI